MINSGQRLERFAKVVLGSGAFWSLFVASCTAWIFSSRVERPWTAARLELQGNIVSGLAPEPYRFRILIPHLSEPIIKFLSNFTDPYWAHAVWFLILNSLLLWVVFYCVWALVDSSKLNTKVVALLLAGSAWNIALFDHFYQPWSLAEGSLFAIAAVAFKRGKLGYLYPITVIATLNRETGLLIPASLILLSLVLEKRRDSKRYITLFGAFITGAVTYAALRYLIGPAPAVNSIEDIFAQNISAFGLAYLTLNLTLLSSPLLAALMIKTFREGTKPWFLAIAPQFALILVFGIWLEVRLIVPYLIFAFPAVASLMEHLVISNGKGDIAN